MIYGLTVIGPTLWDERLNASLDWGVEYILLSPLLYYVGGLPFAMKLDSKLKYMIGMHGLARLKDLYMERFIPRLLHASTQQA